MISVELLVEADQGCGVGDMSISAHACPAEIVFTVGFTSVDTPWKQGTADAKEVRAWAKALLALTEEALT